MIVTVSKNITWNVIEYFKNQDFIIPDSMKNSSNEEIILYLEESDQLDNADWDLIKDKWYGSKYEFSLEWREEMPEDE